MKIAICGVAGHGFDFLKLFHLHPAVESVVFADLAPALRERASESFPDAQAFEAFDELLDTDVDCVGVFTPPWLHADQTIRALEAGKHVLAACPAALTLDQLRAVVDAVERTGNIYMTAETSYYRPSSVYARQAWAEERFGRFVYGEGEYYYHPHTYEFWMRDYYGNMPPVLYPTHSTAMVVGVTGERIERVTCIGVPGLHPDAAVVKRRDEWKDNEVSNMTILGQTSTGGSCRINEMRNCGAWGEMGSIIGTEGSIRQHSNSTVWSTGNWENDVNLSQLWKDPTQHPHHEPASRLPAEYEATAHSGHGRGHGGSHRFLADEFVRSVTQDKRPHNHVWLAAKYCAPGITAWESLKQDSAWLDVPDFGEPNDGREPLGW